MSFNCLCIYRQINCVSKYNAHQSNSNYIQTMNVTVLTPYKRITRNIMHIIECYKYSYLYPRFIVDSIHLSFIIHFQRICFIIIVTFYNTCHISTTHTSANLFEVIRVGFSLNLKLKGRLWCCL